MNRDDDKELWDLLGRAGAPQPSPFFARNVLRRVRQQPRWQAQLRTWLGWRRLVPATTVAIALIGGILLTHRPNLSNQVTTDSDPIAKIDPQDYDVVADLDNLLATEDNNLWDDDDSTL